MIYFLIFQATSKENVEKYVIYFFLQTDRKNDWENVNHYFLISRCLNLLFSYLPFRILNAKYKIRTNLNKTFIFIISQMQEKENTHKF